MDEKTRKPTGDIGSVRYTVGEPDVEFLRVPFPTAKQEIERIVARPFLAAAQRHELLEFDLLDEPQQNPEDDFDFALHTNQGKKYLELMEIAPLEGPRSYETAPSSYDIYEFADWILKQILEKSIRYARSTHFGIVLLTYVTHWKFLLNENVFFLLSYWLKANEHSFESIFHLSHVDRRTVSVSRLFPIPGIEFRGFDPAIFRGSRIVNFDPGRWKVV